MILSISSRPTLVCADGDDAGLAASERWIRTLMSHGRETIATVLPHGYDPASWLREHAADGLLAFTGKGCLDRPAEVFKPVPAGGLLAARLLAEEVAKARQRDPYAETVTVLPAVVTRLASDAAKVPGEAARHRFAASAGSTLARLADGMDAHGRAQQVLAAIHQQTRLDQSANHQVVRCVSR